MGEGVRLGKLENSISNKELVFRILIKNIYSSIRLLKNPTLKKVKIFKQILSLKYIYV